MVNKKDVMFSVIIPAFNAQECIERSISSVIKQTNSDFEIIVIDDGSEDNTSSVVSNLKDERITLIKQQNQGVSVARNLGIKNSKGKYICFLDADDIWLENHLETLRQMILKFPSEYFFVTGYRNQLLNGQIKNISINPIQKDLILCENNLFDFFYKYASVFNTNCVCIERKVFEQVGMFEANVTQGEDTDLWYRIGLYYNIVISSRITTVRFRDYSVATGKRIYNDNWIFESRVEKLLQDSSIEQARKYSLIRDIENRKVTKVRHKLLQGKRKEAWNMFIHISKRHIPFIKYCVTLLCFLIPQNIILHCINRRDKGYYKEEK